MKRNAQMIILLSILIFTASSCGIMFGGMKYNGTIIAKGHPNASIIIDGKEVGKGQVVGRYSRQEPLTVLLKQDGCDPIRQTFEKRFRVENFALNALQLNPFGFLADLAAGSCYKPDYKNDPAIQKKDFKNYIFTVDYTGCPEIATMY